MKTISFTNIKTTADREARFKEAQAAIAAYLTNTVGSETKSGCGTQTSDIGSKPDSSALSKLCQLIASLSRSKLCG